MRNVFIFPGQGTQNNEMLKNLKSYSFKSVMEVFEEASEIYGINLTNLIECSTNEMLSNVAYTQIVMFTMDVAYLKLLEELGVYPHITAGHSLGQYVALIAAGVLEFRETCEIIKERARLMSEIKTPGCLCAVKANQIDFSFISNLCREVSDRQNGEVQIALYNSNKQVVIGGSRNLVEIFCEKIKGYKMYSTKILQVGQAFHTSLMGSIIPEFREILTKLHINKQRIPVILNCTGDYYVEDCNGDNLRNELVEQCWKPVQWIRTMEKIIDVKDACVIEVGPGHSLAGLFKNFAKDIKVIRSDSKKSISMLLKEEKRE